LGRDLESRLELQTGTKGLASPGREKYQD